MAEQLFKINISTDIMVYASNAKEAVLLAKQKATNEIEAANFAPSEVKYTDEVPKDWLEYIPYSPSHIEQIDKKCKEIVVNRPVEIVKPVEPVIEPEPKPEPNKPSISPMPPLKFDIPIAGRNIMKD